MTESKQTIVDFVKAGDNCDVELLKRVLRKDFRVTNNGFMGTLGVTIINKEEYLETAKMQHSPYPEIPSHQAVLTLSTYKCLNH